MSQSDSTIEPYVQGPAYTNLGGSRRRRGGKRNSRKRSQKKSKKYMRKMCFPSQ